MSLKTLVCFLFLLLGVAVSASDDDFTFNGFTGADLTLDGIASITSDGLLRLTNETKQMKGHAFHLSPLHFRKPPDGKIFSFSTTFVFAIAGLGGHGIAFLVSPTTDLSKASQSQYLGLFNSNNNDNSTKHIFAIELDAILNCIGMDISLRSNSSHTAGYYVDNTGLFENLSLISGQPMQVWVEYDGKEMQLNVTIAPIRMFKPRRPLLSSNIDLSSVFWIFQAYFWIPCMLDSLHQQTLFQRLTMSLDGASR